jgi:tellurite methyltransferase
MGSNISLPTELLDRWFTERFARPANAEPSPVYGPVPEAFAEVLASLPGSLVIGGRALDVSCGDGRYTLALAERGFSVLALDHLPAALTRAAEVVGCRGLSQRVQFHSARLPSDLASLGRFDFVVCGSCFLHLLGRTVADEVICQIKAATKPCGVNFVCLSTNILRQLPCGHSFSYDREASYGSEEAEEILRRHYFDWEELALHREDLAERWDIPTIARASLGAAEYTRTETEVTFAARRPPGD